MSGSEGSSSAGFPQATPTVEYASPRTPRAAARSWALGLLIATVVLAAMPFPVDLIASPFFGGASVRLAAAVALVAWPAAIVCLGATLATATVECVQAEPAARRGSSVLSFWSAVLLVVALIVTSLVAAVMSL